MSEGDGFIVTSQMIYTQLLQTQQAILQIQSDLNLVKEKMDRLTTDRQDHENRIRSLESIKVGDKVEDHEGRLRSVERKILIVAGSAGGVVAGLVQVFNAFVK